MNSYGHGIDLQNILSKLPFSTTNRSGELHYIISPGNVSNFCGPGTHILERIQSGGPDSIPKNQVDAAAKIHDIAYYNIEKEQLSKEETLNKKHIADKQMLENLSQINCSSLSERLNKFIMEKIMKVKLKFGMGIDTET